MTGCYGQDWASYQGTEPDTTGLSFAFVKATEGLTYTNPRYTRQVAHARLNHLVVGHYHYPHMANGPVQEAHAFLAVIHPQPGEMLCLDWEGYDAANTGVPMADQIQYKDAFLAYIRGMVPSLQVGTYANVDYLNRDPHGQYGDFLWIANPAPAGSPGVAHPWLFHQYSANPLDKDYCKLSAADLKVWAQKEIEMPLTPADAKVVWAYEHGTESDMHAQLVAANQQSAATLKAVQALALKQPEIDYAKLAAALLAALKA